MLEGQKLKLGVTGGGNITFLRLTNSSEISNDENLKPFLGFSAGLVIKLKISEPWQLSLNSDFIKTSDILEYVILHTQKSDDFSLYVTPYMVQFRKLVIRN